MAAPHHGGLILCLSSETGHPFGKLNGTTAQFDVLSHWLACQCLTHFPLEGHLRCLVDHAKFITEKVPKWHMSIEGQHMGEGGATAVQELAFALSSGIFYVNEFIKAGLKVDDFAPQLSFFFTMYSDFFEGIAKLRAGRRIWAKLLKDRFGARNPRSWQFKVHIQTTGVELAPKQPLNNIARSALHTLAAVLGGVQSIHTDSYDEPLWTPTLESQRVALMTQNIIAEETGVTNVVDPLGGAYFIESLTNEVEERAWEHIEKIDKMGGMFEALKKGYPQTEVTKSAVQRQKEIDSGERVWVGINKYVIPEVEEQHPPQVKVDPELIQRQIERTQRLRKERDQKKAKEALDRIRAFAENGEGNIFEAIVEAAGVGITSGEIVRELREVFGFGRPPTFY